MNLFLIAFVSRSYLRCFQTNASKAPVLLWLQGGPGGSSLFGLFVEHGPFSVTKEGTRKACSLLLVKCDLCLYFCTMSEKIFWFDGLCAENFRRIILINYLNSP